MVEAGGVLSTKSSLESLLSLRFLLASFFLGDLVVELLADSGVLSLVLFLVLVLLFETCSLGVFLAALVALD